jgi:hypothetical protein
VVVQYGAERLVEIAFSGPTTEFSDLIRRASAGGYNEAVKELSRLLGGAAVRAKLSSPRGLARELDALLRDALALDWQDDGALIGFLAGVYFGATDVIPLGGTWPPESEAAWLEVVQAVASRWPFTRPGAADDGQFPVDSIFSVLIGVESEEARVRLFLGLLPTLETVLRDGVLADFCEVHFGLKGLVTGGDLVTRRGRERRRGLPASLPVEAGLLALCRASAERVARWKSQGKTKADLGWLSGLDGRDSAELFKCCLGASRDRNRIKRELAPLVDILASAGARSVAAAVFTHMRRS